MWSILAEVPDKDATIRLLSTLCHLFCQVLDRVRLYLDFPLCKASDRSKMVFFLASLGRIGILIKVCGLCDLGGPGPIQAVSLA